MLSQSTFSCREMLTSRAEQCVAPPQHPSEDDFLFIFSDQEVFTKMLKRSDEVRVRCERLRQFTREKKE